MGGAAGCILPSPCLCLSVCMCILEGELTLCSSGNTVRRQEKNGLIKQGLKYKQLLETAGIQVS